MKQLVITPRTSTAYLCTLAAVRTVAKWLKTRHNFTPGDDEYPVYMTGYQYIFFGVVVCLVFLALSIKID